jgi:hypothetical protein
VLYDKDDNVINLADYTKPKIQNMKKIELNGAQVAALNLKAESTDTEVATAITNLVAKAAKADQLQTELAAKTTELTTAQTELAALKTTTAEKEINDLVAKGIEEKKITVEVGEQLKKDYKGNPTGLKNLVATLPAYAPLSAKMEEDKKKNEKEYTDLAAMSGNTLMENGKMEIVKTKYPELYKEKMAEIKKEANGN